jgi:RNA:NAD 2'-phosphotransferase (TPT1/KptA family)
MKITKQGVKVIFFDSMNLKKARVSFFRSGLKVSKADRVPKTVIARQLQLSRSLEKAQLFHEHICI